MSELTLVTGAGGFIGGHLFATCVAKGVAVRAVDKKPLDEWYFRSSRRPKTSSPICSWQKHATWPAKGSRTFTIWPPIWAAWALSKATRPAACCRC